MLSSKIFSLDVTLNVIVGARDNCGLYSAGGKFLKVNVLCCLRYHLKDIEELLLL